MEKNVLNSLNSEFSELELQQLEERLETNLLLGDGFINLNDPMPTCWLDLDCPSLQSCELTIH